MSDANFIADFFANNPGTTLTMPFDYSTPWGVDTSIDLEDHHTPCPTLEAEAHSLACDYAVGPPKTHTDQGYPIRGGRAYVTDHRSRKWLRRHCVDVVIRVNGREGVATVPTF